MPDRAPAATPPAPQQPHHPRRLVVTDVDSTFLTQEVIELIAEHAGTRDEVAAVTERAMRGELDFAASLRERVATLAGLPVTVLDAVRDAVVLMPGAAELVAEVHRRGWEFGLVSGGFAEILEPLAAEHGITRWRANRLEVADGLLTGRTVGPVVDRAYKEATLREWAAELGLPLEATVAVGDGANDLDMIGAAGVGIAFAAKPVVREQAPYSLDGPRLDDVLQVVDEVDARTA
ncbi:phosphoserine phosphatase [Isoptericola jiangsuensis]|uniref:phosphoserine phosphatase n=1 Tax=Isoptericola jiangsuensis TaxID=548579 RepID=A0A2A9EXC5_9MICO|nr:phosphoserine phosphatase SerB [Isoptericola jiangsuensis]PFG42962.1 phosphoserine phosphatase [Isoptericola jiangsuensis]